jgi:hypothetical protein
MKRFLVCTACIASMLTVAIAVVLAVGIELVQREKQHPLWKAMAQ